jgi:hypothetical protein
MLYCIIYSPQHPIVKHPQPTFLPQCERPSFTPIQNNKHNYSTVYTLSSNCLDRKLEDSAVNNFIKLTSESELKCWDSWFRLASVLLKIQFIWPWRWLTRRFERSCFLHIHYKQPSIILGSDLLRYCWRFSSSDRDVGLLDVSEDPVSFTFTRNFV